MHRDSRHALPPRLLVMAGVRRGHAAGSRGRPSAVAGVTEGSPAASPARVCVCTHAARLRTRALFTAVPRLSHGHDRGARATSMSPRGIFNKTLPSRKSPNVMQMLLSTRYHTRQSHMARAARCCLPCKTAHESHGASSTMLPALQDSPSTCDAWRRRQDEGGAGGMA